MSVVGADSDSRHRNPTAVTTMFLTWPSGDPKVRRIRDAVSSLSLFHPCPSVPSRGTCVVLHTDLSTLVLPLAPTESMLAWAPQVLCTSPPLWFDPSTILFLLFLSFEEYLDGRADAINWLAPLYGRTVVGTCGRSECHTRALAEQVNDLVYWRIRCTNPNFSARYFGGRGQWRGDTLCISCRI